MLDTDSLEFLEVETEQFQNGRSDLRGLDRRRNGGAARGSGPGYQDRDVPVFGVIAAVLGDLGFVPSAGAFWAAGTTFVLM